MLFPVFNFDSNFQKLGLNYIVFAVVHEMDQKHLLSDTYLSQLHKVEQSALDIETSELESLPVLQGYVELVRQIGRSPKKFPPSAWALIDIIKRHGKFPHILPIVDIYNIITLTYNLSLGVHDLSKLKGEAINFRISPGGEFFYPIGGGEKRTKTGDYVYSDSDTLLAWLDARDSERVKVMSQTRDIIIVIQGNVNTSLEYRVRALEELCHLLVKTCGGMAMLGKAEVTSSKTNWWSLNNTD
ncbi:B3/4 domain-containing protein [Aeromonas enteropelogenes]|uniref:B3/B4 domain-containing protein n=1 Tax=Aeromonas enteropelogenes TaxID=29489 RepID=UPI0038CF3757